MVDKDINIRVTIDTSNLVQGVKQMSDELKKFTSEATRSGNLISEVFKKQQTEIKEVNINLKKLESGLKSTTESFSKFGGKEIKMKLFPPDFEKKLAQLPLLKQQYLELTKIFGSEAIKSLEDFKAAKNVLKEQAAMDRMKNSVRDLINYLNTPLKTNFSTLNSKPVLKDLIELKKEFVTISSSAKGLNMLHNAFDLLRNKIKMAANEFKQFFNLPLGKSIIAGIAGGATLFALQSLLDLFKKLTFALKNFVMESSQVSIIYDGLINRFNAAAGGIRQGTESFIFLKNLSKTLGVNFIETSGSFGTFEAAALRSGLSMEQTKRVFSDVSTAVVSLQLDSYRTGLSFMALSQMASKGTVQMEELKRQLGESLPGAVQIGARAMGMGTAEFHKMVEEGKLLSSEFLPKFAAQIKKELGGSVLIASQQARAEFERFKNATMDLKDSVGDLLNTAAIPFARAFTPIISSMSLSINKFMDMEKGTHSLRDAIKDFAIIIGVTGASLALVAFSAAIKGINISIITGLIPAIKILIGQLYALTVAMLSNPYIAVGAAVLTLTTILIAYIRTRKTELSLAKENYESVINEKSGLQALESEVSKAISSYEDLRKEKNRTKKQQKEFLDLQSLLIKAFPNVSDGLKQNKSAVALLADEYNRLEKSALKARKAILFEEIKDLTKKPKLSMNIFESYVGPLIRDLTMGKEKKDALIKLKESEVGKIDLSLKALDTQQSISAKESDKELDKGVTQTESRANKAARIRKKQYEDEIKFEENALTLKLAKERLSEDEIDKLKQNSLNFRLNIAQKYYNKETDLLNKADFKQDIEKSIIEQFNLKKEYDNKKLESSLSLLDQLQKETLSISNSTELQQLQIQKSTNDNKLILLTDFIAKTETKEKEYLKKLEELQLNGLDLEKQINNQKIKDHNQLIDYRISEIGLGAEKEIILAKGNQTKILDIEIETNKKILAELGKKLAVTHEESIKNAEEIAKKELEIEKQKEEKRLKLVNTYGGRYGVDFRRRLQIIVDDLPDTTKFEKFWKDLTNIAADAMTGLSNEITVSFTNNIEKLLEGALTLKEGFKSLFEDIKQVTRKMIMEIIAELIKLYVVQPFIKDIFGIMFGTNPFSNIGVPKIPGFAKGGRPPVKFPSIVGEKGPELFIPDSAGTILPNNKLTPGTSNNNYVYAPQITTGVTAGEVFNVLEKHSRQFFSMIADGAQNNTGLRDAIRGT